MDFQPRLPISISQIGSKYLLFDIKVASWLRREHHLCGANIGTLPQSPSQNVFLGLPIEIIPEEAQLLVEKGVAVISDDGKAHREALQSPEKSNANAYLASVQKQAANASKIKTDYKEEQRKQTLKKRAPTEPADSPTCENSLVSEADDTATEETSLFDSPSTLTAQTSDTRPPSIDIHNITPTTSHKLLPTMPETAESKIVINLPSSYPLYKHLHDKGYFMTPGLRFGCQYTVYPGDPLRFHSHFLAVGAQWDEELDLMDIVGGGRLGTGVKKGYLLGGQDPTGQVRTFSVEWAAM